MHNWKGGGLQASKIPINNKNCLFTIKILQCEYEYMKSQNIQDKIAKIVNRINS